MPAHARSAASRVRPDCPSSSSYCRIAKTKAPAWRRLRRSDVDLTWQLLRRHLRRLGVLPAEALDASRSVNKLLLAGKERVAARTDFHVDVALVGRTGDKIRATSAHDPDFVIVWMNPCLRHSWSGTFPAIFLFYADFACFATSRCRVSTSFVTHVLVDSHPQFDVGNTPNDSVRNSLCSLPLRLARLRSNYSPDCAPERHQLHRSKRDSAHHACHPGADDRQP